MTCSVSFHIYYVIKKGDLIIFESPEGFLKDRSIWTTTSFIDNKEIAFYVSDEVLYLVIEIFQGYEHAELYKAQWFNIMEPYGKRGWWYDTCATIDGKRAPHDVHIKRIND